MNRRDFVSTSLAVSAAGIGCLSDAAQAATPALRADHPGPLPGDHVARLRSAENPYGPPKSALKAAEAELARGNRYPRDKITELRDVIAKDAGLTPEHVAIGAGSIELMINAGLAYGKPGRAVLSVDPTWDTMVLYAEEQGAEWIRVPLTEKYRYDFDRMKSALTDKVDLVYICNPNNPTGLAEDEGELEAFVKEVAPKRIVMVDEAFIDCLDNAEAISMKRLIREYDNVIVARTFSKLWGMAGFRMGYMLGHPKVIAKLESTIPKLEMQNRIGAAAAIGAFGDREFMDFSRAKMKESRGMVFEILDRHGLTYIPSDSNFVAFQATDDGDKFVEKMYERDVLLKNVTFGGQTWIRVSCGAPNELEAFDQALGLVL